MAQRRSIPVVAIILTLVLFPFVTIAGERLPASRRGSPTAPGGRGRFRPIAPKPHTPNDNPVFFNPETYLSGGVYAVSVTVGDFNGDGKADLAVANQCPQNNCSAGSVSVLLGNGDGTFQAAQSYSTGG